MEIVFQSASADVLNAIDILHASAPLSLVQKRVQEPDSIGTKEPIRGFTPQANTTNPFHDVRITQKEGEKERKRMREKDERWPPVADAALGRHPDTLNLNKQRQEKCLLPAS